LSFKRRLIKMVKQISEAPDFLKFDGKEYMFFLLLTTKQDARRVLADVRKRRIVSSVKMMDFKKVRFRGDKRIKGRYGIYTKLEY